MIANVFQIAREKEKAEKHRLALAAGLLANTKKAKHI
jgi:hypothetical protein